MSYKVHITCSLHVYTKTEKEAKDMLIETMWQMLDHDKTRKEMYNNIHVEEVKDGGLK